MRRGREGQARSTLEVGGGDALGIDSLDIGSTECNPQNPQREALLSTGRFQRTTSVVPLENHTARNQYNVLSEDTSRAIVGCRGFSEECDYSSCLGWH